MTKKEKEIEYHRLLTKKYTCKDPLTKSEIKWMKDYAKHLNNTVYKEENKNLKKENNKRKAFLKKADKILKELEDTLKKSK